MHVSGMAHKTPLPPAHGHQRSVSTDSGTPPRPLARLYARRPDWRERRTRLFVVGSAESHYRPDRRRVAVGSRPIRRLLLVSGRLQRARL